MRRTLTMETSCKESQEDQEQGRSELLSCRACLGTERLYDMHRHGLVEPYRQLTGLEVHHTSPLPQHLCAWCSSVLLKYSMFKERCQRVDALLRTIVDLQATVTCEDISHIDRYTHGLLLPYTQSQTHLVDYINETRLITEDTEDVRTDDELSLDYDIDCLDEQTIPEVNVIIKTDGSIDDTITLDGNDGKRRNSAKEIFIKRKHIRNCELKKSDEDEKNQRNEELIILNNDIEEIIVPKEEQIAEVLSRKDSFNYKNYAYKCNQCFKAYVNQDVYKCHMKRHDLSSGRHECDVCHIRFGSEVTLRSHSTAAHSRKYSCKLCGAVVKRQLDAQDHVRRHNGFRFSCKLCSTSFARRESYLKHKRVQHSAEYSCADCGQAYHSSRGLNMHRAKAHVQSKESSEHIQPNEPDEKPYACIHCPKRFRDCQSLQSLCNSQIHLRTHTGERPYQCPHCPKAFKHKPALNRHNRVHTGAKPYACSHCDKSFSQSNSMKLHVRTVHLKMPAPYRSRRNKTNDNS